MKGRKRYFYAVIPLLLVLLSIEAILRSWYPTLPSLDALSVRENAYSIVTQQGASVSGLGSCELGAGQTEALDLSGTDALPIWDEPMF